MPADTSTPSAAHWSEYWASGALTSLPQDFSFNYDGEVERFWREQFETVPSGGRILDICTGNGPIALLAARWARETDLRIDVTAVDAARIRPDRIAQRSPADAESLAAIRFLGETPVEALPFEEGSFDLVTSQYGLEYCRLDEAAAQVARVLTPGGRLVMVCHAPSSEMIETMAEEQRDYQALESARFFGVFRSWVGGQLSEPDLQQRLARVQRQLSEAYRRSRSPLLGQVIQSVGSLLDMNLGELRKNKSAVSGFLGRMEAGRDRLADMLRVNRRIAEDPQWHRPLNDAGLQRLESRPLEYRGHAMGQCHIWRRPA